MASNPRFTIELSVHSPSGQPLDFLSSNVMAQQTLEVRNETNRAYNVRGWASAKDSRVTYPNSPTPSARTSGSVRPGGKQPGVEEILYDAAGHPTPISVEIELRVDWRQGVTGSWTTRQHESSYIDCRP